MSEKLNEILILLGVDEKKHIINQEKEEMIIVKK